MRVGESEGIGLGFLRVAAYSSARGRAWMFGMHRFRPVKLVAKNFGPVYFQKAKLQIFLHFGPKSREVNKACADVACTFILRHTKLTACIEEAMIS